MNKLSQTETHYNWLYQTTSHTPYQAIRTAAYGEDFGQAGWSTAKEIDKHIGWLSLKSAAYVLDVGCGVGGVTLRLAQRVGCRALGIDSNEEAIAQATANAKQQDLADRVTFEVHDAGQTLPFADATFDAILCYDAITHLPDRLTTLRDWARLLKPKGQILYLDPLIMAAPLSTEEIGTRSGTGFNVFSPAGSNRRLIKRAGLRLARTADRSKGLITVAQNWAAACAEREEALIALEGEAAFNESQAFHQMAAKLAKEKKLLRYVFVAKKRK